jgi:O-antigen/teichoic acid export membrane protein
MGLLKKLAGQTALYGLSSILGRMVNYLLLPLHTALLDVESYGVVTEFYIYTAFLMVVYTFGMETTYFRMATKSHEHKEQALPIAQSVLMAISLSISLLIIAFSPILAEWVNTPLGASFFIWMAIILLVDALAALPFSKLRLEHKAFQFASLKLIMIFANLALNVFFLYLLPLMDDAPGSIYKWLEPVEWILLANLLSSGLIFVFFRSYFLQMHLKWNSVLSKQAIRYGAPIMLMGVAGMINELFGRLMLKYQLPPNFYPGWNNQEILGIYGGCYKLSIFMTLAIQSFRYAAEPFFFAQSTKQEARKDFARIMLWFVILCVVILLVVSFNLGWIGDLFLRKPAYKLALPAVPLLLFANLFLGMYYNFSVWFKLTDKTIYGSYISGGGMLATLMLNFILVPIAGFMGSAFATLLVYLGMSVACYKLGQKYYPIPYPIRKISFYILLGLVLLTLDHWWLKTFTFQTAIVKFLLFTLFLSAVVWLEKLEPIKWLKVQAFQK